MKKAFALLLTCSLATPLAACTQAIEEAATDIAEPAALEQEYAGTLASLKFPSGFTPAATLELEEGTLYGKGWGMVVASYEWECAWEREWLDSYATDSARAEAALAQLEQAPDMEYHKDAYADDATGDLFTEKLAKARLGDPSGIADDIELNCRPLEK